MPSSGLGSVKEQPSALAEAGRDGDRGVPAPCPARDSPSGSHSTPPALPSERAVSSTQVGTRDTVCASVLGVRGQLRGGGMPTLPSSPLQRPLGPACLGHSFAGTDGGLLSQVFPSVWGARGVLGLAAAGVLGSPGDGLQLAPGHWSSRGLATWARRCGPRAGGGAAPPSQHPLPLASWQSLLLPLRLDGCSQSAPPGPQSQPLSSSQAQPQWAHGGQCQGHAPCAPLPAGRNRQCPSAPHTRSSVARPKQHHPLGR